MIWLEDKVTSDEESSWDLRSSTKIDEIRPETGRYGWVWTTPYRVDMDGGYRAVIQELPNGRDSQTFDTVGEAKAWLVAAVVYYQITGELAPKDIHKEVV